MLELVITRIEGKRRKQPKPKTTRSIELERTLNEMGVVVIRNLDAIGFNSRRWRLDAGKHGYDMRELARVVERHCGFRPSANLLVKTLRRMRKDRFGV